MNVIVAGFGAMVLLVSGGFIVLGALALLPAVLSSTLDGLVSGRIRDKFWDGRIIPQASLVPF
jgi:hypothetical protein